ncbi:TetR/AcrR family transcriptional regulator [Stackebrandtia nassauensis]|nr:TetR/AcrR family transcriptional regulator [Stackebrandtia nassauensis]
MLDACAVLLDEIGYQKLTTTLIAQRAEVAIGSVYQFFGDKRAVVRALDVRYLDEYMSRLENYITAEKPQHWSQFVDAAIDEYIDMHRTVPGFRTLHFGDTVDIHLMDEERSNDDVLTERLLELIFGHFSFPDQQVVRLTLTVAVATGDALIKLAFRHDPEGDDTILNEAKVLLRDYLSRHIA